MHEAKEVEYQDFPMEGFVTRFGKVPPKRARHGTRELGKYK